MNDVHIGRHDAYIAEQAMPSLASMLVGRTPTQVLRDELGFVPRNIPAAASEARRAKRALVKAFGIRQFKKVKA